MTAATVHPSTGLGVTARIIGNEVGKGLRIVWGAYRSTLLPTLIGTTGFYLMFQYFVGGGSIIDELVADTAPGMFAYVVSFMAMLRIVAGILEERNAGTLEQIHLSPLPAWQLAVGRLAAVLTEAILTALIVVAPVLVLMNVTYPADVSVLVPAALMLAGIAGFVMLVGAASFTFPGIGALVHVIQMGLMIVNGTAVPIEVFPGWLELLAKFAPATLGVQATRRILVERDSLTDLWGDGALGWLVLHTAVLVAIGWTVYRWQIRRALRDGKLGPA